MRSRSRSSHRRHALLIVVALAALIGSGGVRAQGPTVFEAGAEGQIWETLVPAFGQDAEPCLWADILPGDDVAGHAYFDPLYIATNGAQSLYPMAYESLRYRGAPPQCPGGAQLGSDQLYDPRGVAVFDPGGPSDPTDPAFAARLNSYRVYAADSLNNRIVSWDYYGTHVTTFGSGTQDAVDALGNFLPGVNDEFPTGEVFRPDGLTTDASGNVIVADTRAGRLSIFGANGVFQYVVNMPGISKSSTPEVRGLRAWPAQVAVAPGTIVQPPAADCSTLGTGRVAVATWPPDLGQADPSLISTDDNQYMNAVIVYDEKFCRVATLGAGGALPPDVTPEGSFAQPAQLVFDQAGRLFVSDYYNGKVVVFSTSGNTYDPTPVLVMKGVWDTGPAAGDTVVPVDVGLNGAYGIAIDNRYSGDATSERIIIGNSDAQELAVVHVSFPTNGVASAAPVYTLNSKGGLSGFPRELAQDAEGRYIVAVPGQDKIQLFQIPKLAVYNEAWASTVDPSAVAVHVGDAFNVTFDAVVPPLKPSVSGVTSTVAVDSTLADLVSAPTGSVDLTESQVQSFSYQYKATAAAAGSDIAFTVGATAPGPVTAPGKTVTVHVLPADCTTGIAPTISGATRQTPSANGWNSDGTVTLHAQDGAGSGLQQIFYEFAGVEGNLRTGRYSIQAPDQTFTFDTNIAFTATGSSSVTFWAVDHCGVESTHTTLPIQLDTVAPSASFSILSSGHQVAGNGIEWWNAPVHVTVIPTDQNSTGDLVFPMSPQPTPAVNPVPPDSSFPATGTASADVQFSQEGLNEGVWVRATDKAGNVGYAYSLDKTLGGRPISIDLHAPVTTATTTAVQPYVGSIPVTLTASDSLSGVAHIYYSLDNQTFTKVDGGTATVTLSGTSTIYYYADDWATNKEATNSTTYTIAPPTATADSATTNEDASTLIDVLANDVDGANGTTFTLQSVTLPQHGTAAVTDRNHVQYTPSPNYNSGFNGDDSFNYTATNANGYSISAQVTVHINAVNDPPESVPDSVTTPEDTPIDILPLANDLDVDRVGLSLTSVDGPSQGTVSISPDLQTVHYTPNRDFNGIDQFQYHAVNGRGEPLSSTVRITVTAVNDPPTASSFAVVTPEDTPLAIDLLAQSHAADVDGPFPLVATAGAAAHGTVTPTANGVLYTPASNYNGSDLFTFTVTDGAGASTQAQVTINVTPVNDPPTADSFAVTTAEDTPITIDVLAGVPAHASDVDGDSLTVTATGAAHGTASIVNNQIVYAPAANYNGADTITYTVTDPSGAAASAAIAITVTPVNDPPTASSFSATTNEDTPLAIDLLAQSNAADVDSPVLTASLATQPAHGTVSIVANIATYTPSANYNGPDSFTFTISDGQASITRTASITVTPVNDPPTAISFPVTATAGVGLAINVLAHASDVDNDTLTVTTGSPAHGTLTASGNGSFTYTAAANYVGPDSFTYTVADPSGATATAIVSITVQPSVVITTTSITAPTVTYAANGVVTVTVTAATGTPSGAVSLTVDGGAPLTAPLSGGVATFTLTSPNAGDHALAATYAPQGTFLGSDATGTLKVKTSGTTTVLTTSGANPSLAGASLTFIATVTPVAPGSGIPDGSVTFKDGSTVLATVPVVGGIAMFNGASLAVGPHAISATYSGSTNYFASSAVGINELIYGLAPGGGSFVIGDQNSSLGTAVTFWGAQWRKLNSLSGGDAPASFKGFAESPAVPQCGTTWSTDPGNSTPPPAGPLPAYMAVLVTSASVKSGATIYGNTVAMVVVQTNGGYKGDPGHAGTGTVVATLCTGSGALPKPATTLSYTGSTQGSTGSVATLSAALTDQGGNELNGETVTFSLGALRCSDKTDPHGVASCKVTVTQGSGMYAVTASFAGDTTYAGSSTSSTFTVGETSLDCKKVKCESLLADPSIAGSTLSLVYMDDSPIKSATATLNGQSLPVTLTPTSAQPQNYVDSYGGSKSTKNQTLITFQLPDSLPPGTYTIVITAYDGDGDVDQWNWKVTK